ncbi:iron complex outermembrane recepter protein [Sphingomonas gellani]|uniref:Iron complex outermembrane recepter protein n=1 Tax=Sphingomonas gellani TaxID=1166340 RepID=A0A1H8JDW5_9SPHN|nr:TonB-dependent receptor [Sphingomonas gellani]SEN79063.1 iron complex outermembrane recepter protein [Sphingomonas gellani]
MSLTLALLLAGQIAGTPTPQDQTAGPATSTPQQADDAADGEDSGRTGPAAQSGSGEVVVTARRRAESAQRVPIAISVIGGTALAETGTYNVNRLTQIQPTLQFYSTNPRNSAANVRGLGAPFGLTNDGIEQGVGIYVDQVYYSRIASATFDFTDTDRIEVLRGPQGTLYGKNTTAGAINIISRAPSFTPEARVELTGGNYAFFRGKASVSGPLVDDKVAIRLSASVTTRRGTIYNVRQDEWQNSQDNQSFRSQILWKATPSLDLTLSGDYNHQNPNCCVQYYARVGATQRPVTRQYAALAAAQGYRVPSTDPFDRLADVDTDLRAKQELGGLSLLANWDLGGATVTSVSAWRFWNWNPSNDRDFIGLPITTVSANPSQQRQVSQEVRIASDGDRTLDYVAGLFYFRQTIDTQGLQVQGPAASAFLLNPTSTGGRNPATLNNLTSRNTIGFTNTSAAVFGKLTWHATDRLSVSPGLRVNYDRKSGHYLSTVTNGTGTALTADQLGVLAPQSYDPRFSNWNLSGDLTVAYDVTPDVHYYATYARSYKSGGINLSGLPLNATNTGVDLSTQTVDPEKVNHFELGLKTQALGRRLTANLAAFWTEIDDYQATVNNGQLTVIRGYLANAGKVRTRGVELDTALRPTDRLNLYANAAYTDAKYVRFPNAPCPPELSGGNPALNGATPAAAGTPGLSPLVCDISGRVLPGVSKWALSYGAEYDVPVQLGDTAGQVYFGYDGSYRSRFSSNPSPSAYTYIGGYALSNFRLGVKTDTRWNIFAWVRNAFDRDYFELLATQSGSTGLIVGQPGDPRTYGVTVSKAF